jgi:hypothetical protein
MGYSGAGKDSLCKAIQGLTQASNIKWSRPAKDMFERHYDLPDGFLDDPLKRLEVVPEHPDGITWLDLMIRSKTHLLAIDPLFCIRKVRKIARFHLGSGRDIIFTDTRNYQEAKAISDELAYEHQVTLVWVSRPGKKPLESDQDQMGIFGELSRRFYPHIVINDGDLNKLVYKAQEIVTYAN